MLCPSSSAIIMIQFLVLLLYRPYITALTIKPLPKHNAKDITVDEFDTVYNDKLPIILQESTAC